MRPSTFLTFHPRPRKPLCASRQAILRARGTKGEAPRGRAAGAHGGGRDGRPHPTMAMRTSRMPRTAPESRSPQAPTRPGAAQSHVAGALDVDAADAAGFVDTGPLCTGGVRMPGTGPRALRPSGSRSSRVAAPVAGSRTSRRSSSRARRRSRRRRRRPRSAVWSARRPSPRTSKIAACAATWRQAPGSFRITVCATRSSPTRSPRKRPNTAVSTKRRAIRTQASLVVEQSSIL